VRLQKKYADMHKSQKEALKGNELAEYEYFKKVEEQYNEEKNETQTYLKAYKQFNELYMPASQTAKHYLKKKTLSKEDIESLPESNDSLAQAKRILLYLGQLGVDEDRLKEGLKQLETKLNYQLNLAFDPRSTVGDDPANLTEKGYGNPDVRGPDADHGTHVAGIIGANRNNNLGIMGVADNVILMPVRVVPDGDERDKDVANGIRYAVDNGAKIINMSFGKSFSPNREIVDQAIRYAASKGVLLVHAAGNDGENLDKEDNFPTNKFAKVNTWIEVGASTAEENLAASFSNYGKQSVDLFAPGRAIYATVPDNKYANHDGTSMAAPVVSGVAALVWSYYPQLSAEQVKEVLLKSAVRYTDLKVGLPGGEEKIAFGELSKTGAIVNAYEAVKLADSIKAKKAR
jgi:cell wall-associated protease